MLHDRNLELKSGPAPVPFAPSAAPVRASARTLVVVGGGMAAHRLCRELADERSPRTFERIVMLAEEPRPAYDRVHLTSLLRGERPESLALSPSDWYAGHRVELCVGERALAVDPRRRRVRTARRELAYDRLVLATGSAPLRPPIPGVDLPGVLVYRTVEDALAIGEAAERARAEGRRVAILGGGLLGVEVARALQQLGCSVDVFERAARLLPRQLDVAASRALEVSVRALGLSLHLAVQVERIEARGDELLVRTAEGSVLAFGAVVVAAGVRPRDELAREAGITCHARGGVEVDDFLATSAPAVYAIGECARHRGTLYGLAAPGHAMAELLAGNLRGELARFPGVAPATRLKAPPVEVSVAGDVESEGGSITRVRYAEGDSDRCLVLRRGRVIGATCIGEWDRWAEVMEAIARHRWILPAQRRRFEVQGSPWRRRAGRSPGSWSDATVVCTCMGVDMGALRRARAQGCADAAALARRTGASTVCGSCEPLLHALAGGGAADAVRERAGGGLLPVALAALLGVAAWAALDPLPLATSVQAPPVATWMDTLWRDGLARQITGFVALGLVATSLLFSLRKRLGWMQRLSFSRWRSVHAIVGALALAAVAVHTGLRWGSNLDRALLLSFLGVSALGGAAALFAALEHRLSPAAGPAVRRVSFLAHVLIAWPFPLLILFHVLKVYWY